MLLLVILLVILAIVTGTLGFLIKGALWLLVIALVCLVAAFLFGRMNSRR
jgi:hypothetical protein